MNGKVKKTSIPIHGPNEKTGKSIRENKKSSDKTHTNGFELGQQVNVFGKIGQNKCSDSEEDSGPETTSFQHQRGKKKKRKTSKTQKKSSLVKDESFVDDFRENNHRAEKKRKISEERAVITSRPITSSEPDKNVSDEQRQLFLGFTERNYHPMSSFLGAYYYNQEKISTTKLKDEAIKGLDKTILMSIQNDGSKKPSLEKEEEDFFAEDDYRDLETSLELYKKNQFSLQNFETEISHYPKLHELYKEQVARSRLYRQPSDERIHTSHDDTSNSSLISQKIPVSIFGLSTNTSKMLPKVGRKYIENYLRQALKEVSWERECPMGDKCVCMLASQIFPDSNKNSSVTETFVGREFLLPAQELEAIRDGTLPEKPQLCILCNRYKTTCNVWMNMQSGTNAKYLFQDHQYDVEGDDGYSKDRCMTPISNSKKFNGLLGYFVKFSLTDYVPTKQLLTLHLNGTTIHKEVRCLIETKAAVPNNSQLQQKNNPIETFDPAKPMSQVNHFF